MVSARPAIPLWVEISKIFRSEKILKLHEFPSSQRRGGCAEAQTGWSDRQTFRPRGPLIEASPYRARASRPARQLLLTCRATPPLRRGEFVQLPTFFPSL